MNDTISDALKRIRAEDADLHAFVHIADDAAAAAADLAGLPLGGLPIAVKDVIDTADMPTGYGSRIYAGHQPAMDGAIVTALKQAGAFIVGKTTTTEFATSPPTATLNPRNVNHTPGGSSAGSAAAVAAGLVSIALGTQTLGSIIRPASYCGVVGFKPTYGWLPSAGMKQLAISLDTVGFLSSDVATTERVYCALVPDDPAPAATGPLRLLFSREPNWHLASPDAQAAIEQCVDRLRAKGFDIAERAMPEGFDDMTRVANVIHDYEMHRALAPEMAIGRDRIDAALVARIDRAGRWSVSDYRDAHRATLAQRAAFSALMGEYDAILCLGAGSEAPVGLSTTGDPMMSSAWTALHVPCLTLPALQGATGMPIGLQLIADRYQDRKLMEIAKRIEAATLAPN